jgi:hypothetical protein
MRYERPIMVDFGSIVEHTFTNDPQMVPGVGPKGKNPEPMTNDKFCEPSHS